MRRLFITITVLILALTGTLPVSQASGYVGHGTSGELQQDEKQGWERLRKRFTEEYASYLSSDLWTLTHGAESQNEMEESLKLLQVLGTALDKNDPTLLNGIGGIKGFKERFLKLLGSADDTVDRKSVV